MTETVESVLALIEQFYTSQTTPEEVRRATNERLEAFQRSVEAWTISDTILHQHALGNTPLSFAAQTIRNKIQRDFHEVPDAQRIDLLSSLLEHLRIFGRVDRPAGFEKHARHIALAVADLAVYMEVWDDPVAYLVEHTVGAQLTNVNSAPGLLEVLRLLPEEISNERLNVTKVRRIAVSASTSRHGNAILSLFEALLAADANSGALRDLILRALASWIEFGKFDTVTLAASPLLALMFESLAVDKLFDYAVDCIISAVYLAEGDYDDDGEQRAELRNALLPPIMQLRSSYSDAQQRDDTNVCRGIAKIFTELGLVNVDAIISFAHESAPLQDIFDAVLFCFQHPEPEVADYTIIFWGRFVDQVLDLAACSGSNGIAHVEAHLYALFDCACGHLVPSEDVDIDDHAELFNSEASDLREECIRLVGELATALGSEQCLQRIVTSLLLAMGATADEAAGALASGSVSLAPEHLQERVSWRFLMGIFEAVGAVGLKCPRGTTIHSASFLVPLLPPASAQGPLGSIPVRRALLRCIESFAWWAAECSGDSTSSASASLAASRALGGGNVPSEEGGQLMEAFIAHAIEALWSSASFLHSSAARAIKRLAAEAPRRLVPRVGDLINVVHGWDAEQLAQRAAVMLVEAAAKTAFTMDSNALAQVVEALCAPILARVSVLCTQLDPSASCTPSATTGQSDVIDLTQQTLSRPDFLYLMDRLCAIFRDTTPPLEPGEVAPSTNGIAESPCLPAFRSTWPVLLRVLQLRSDVDTAESVCRVFKHGLRCVGAAGLDLLSDAAPVIAHLFPQRLHSCFLYLASIFVDVFGPFNECSGGLLDLWTQLCQVAATRITTEQQMQQQPDLVEDFFGLSRRVLDRISPSLLDIPATHNAVQVASRALAVSNREASRAVMSFLVRCTELGPLVLHHGPLMTRALVAGALGIAPPSARLPVAEVLYEMSRRCPDASAFPLWLSQVLHPLPQPVRDAFVKQFQQTGNFHVASDLLEQLRSSLDSNTLVSLLQSLQI